MDDATQSSTPYHRKPAALVSLSGGGFRAAAYHAGFLRTLYEAGWLTRDAEAQVIVNAVSGGALPAHLWSLVLGFRHAGRFPRSWPEEALIRLIRTCPPVGGRLNWVVRGLWFKALRAWESHIRRSIEDSIAAAPPATNHALAEDTPFGGNPLFILEILDFQHGEIYLFSEGVLAKSEREIFKSRGFFHHFKISWAHAIARATAFPLAFPAPAATSVLGQRHVFLDAGLVDNIGFVPLMEFVYRRHKQPLRHIERWFFSNAGRPMSVPQQRLELLDRVFRMTGDIAQPLYFDAISELLRDHIEVPVRGAGIGISPDGEPPWQTTRRIPDVDAAAAVPTALAPMPRADIVCLMAHGAKAACEVLQLPGEERAKIREYFETLNSP